MSLTIVILSFNVKDLLRVAIKSVYDTYKGKNMQLIVVDNASTDGSEKMVTKEFPDVTLIKSATNTGFAAGNNLAKVKTLGEYVLFLNPDTQVKKNTINKCLEIINKNPVIGAVSCKVVLPTGQLDYSCHRGLPTPWNTFCYLFGLTKIFPKNKFFSGYSATYLDTDKSHFIDCISGTFLLTRKSVLNKVGWWDTDYWWNGDDIELCYKLKKAGYKIWYESSVEMLHYKGSSSGLWKTGKYKVPDSIKKRTAISSSKAMSIFVEKHWRELGNWPVMQIVRLGIYVLTKYRLFMINIGKTYK
jgi:GT2 family glycosyltransferase